MSRRAVTVILASIASACRPQAAAVLPAPSSSPASPSTSSGETEPAPKEEGTRLGGVMPTHHADWASLETALEGGVAAKEDAARKHLCEGRCDGPPPWLIDTQHRGSSDREWRLVAPTPDQKLALTPAIVSAYDGICESRVEHEIDADGPVRKVVLHVVQQHVVSRRCPPSEEVCDDSCAEVEWDCTLRVVSETLEMVIDSCTPAQAPEGPAP